MRNRPDTLAEVVDLAMHKHAVDSGRALARIAEHMGVPVSYTTLNEIRAGRYRQHVNGETREALRVLSGVSRAVIDELAGQPPSRPFQLPESADTLTGDQRDAILGVIRAFVRSNERADEAAPARTELGLAASDPTDAGDGDHRRPPRRPKGATDTGHRSR